MAYNPALAELECKSNVSEAKRDLVLRFVRDQESLQTSQVDLKLVDDTILDLIDSTKNEGDINDGVTGICLEDNKPHPPRPPSGRSQSRRLHKKISNDNASISKLKLSKVHSMGEQLSSNNYGDTERFNRTLPSNGSRDVGRLNQTISTSNMDRHTRPMSPPPVDTTPLNSSWPEHQFMSRKISSGRKYALRSPAEYSDLEHSDKRPTSGISANINEGLSSRSTSPSKRRSSKSRGRTFMSLNLEPVHPSEIPLLRGRSASSGVSGPPCTLVHLPPIQTTPPSM